MVHEVTWGRRHLGRAKNGDNGSKSQLGWDFRVVPPHIIDINAYMLILIDINSYMSIFISKRKFIKFRNFVPEPMGCASEWPEPCRISEGSVA